MRIQQLEYHDSNWAVENLDFVDLNLIVGKNAVGKTRSIMTVDLLVQMLVQRRDLNWGGKWLVKFLTNAGNVMEFNFATRMSETGQVSFERMLINGEPVLSRNQHGEVRLRNRQTNRFDWVTPPPNKLTVHSFRDVRRYPYLEDLAYWADNSFGFKFGNISPSTRLNIQEYGLLTSVDDIPFLYQELNADSRRKVIEEFSGLGFAVNNIVFHSRGDLSFLTIMENGIDKGIPHFKLSQGMFRSLALIIYLEYLVSRRRVVTLIIDDLGEGLDYLRAKKLGKLVFTKCESTGIQLLATSNDSFLMDVVDLGYWNLLQRTGKTVSAINQRNSPAVFERFSFTGLSNFDFFASDFLLQSVPQ